MNHVPEMPEEEMADSFVLQGSTEKEFSKLTVKVGLKLEHLYQLKKIHGQHLITAHAGHTTNKRQSSTAALASASVFNSLEYFKAVHSKVPDFDVSILVVQQLHGCLRCKLLPVLQHHIHL